MFCFFIHCNDCLFFIPATVIVCAICWGFLLCFLIQCMHVQLVHVLLVSHVLELFHAAGAVHAAGATVCASAGVLLVLPIAFAGVQWWLIKCSFIGPFPWYISHFPRNPPRSLEREKEWERERERWVCLWWNNHDIPCMTSHSAYSSE